MVTNSVSVMGIPIRRSVMTRPKIAARPKFARVSRGRTTKGKADEYERYLLQARIAPQSPSGGEGPPASHQRTPESRTAATSTSTTTSGAGIRAAQEDPSGDVQLKGGKGSMDYFAKDAGHANISP